MDRLPDTGADARTERLLVLLHGYEGDPAAIAEVGRQVAGSTTRVLAPLGTVARPGGPCWFDVPDVDGEPEGFNESLAHLHSVIDAVANVPVTLGGISQGGIMAVAVAMSSGSTERIGGIWAACAALPAELDPSLDLARLSGRRLLVQTADDDEVVPPLLGRGLARAAERAGADVELQSFKGGHELSPAMVDGLRDWLSRP